MIRNHTDSSCELGAFEKLAEKAKQIKRGVLRLLSNKISRSYTFVYQRGRLEDVTRTENAAASRATRSTMRLVDA